MKRREQRAGSFDVAMLGHCFLVYVFLACFVFFFSSSLSRSLALLCSSPSFSLFLSTDSILLSSSFPPSLPPSRTLLHASLFCWYHPSFPLPFLFVHRHLLSSSLSSSLSFYSLLVIFSAPFFRRSLFFSPLFTSSFFFLLYSDLLRLHILFHFLSSLLFP